MWLSAIERAIADVLPHLERGVHEALCRVVVPAHPVHLADVVEARGHAADVARRFEERVTRAEVTHRLFELADRAIQPAHAVVRGPALGA